MISLLDLRFAILASPFKSKCQLEAENVALRHQVIVLRRQVHGRVHLTNFDRLFLVQLYRWFRSILRAALCTARSCGLGCSKPAQQKSRETLQDGFMRHLVSQIPLTQSHDRRQKGYDIDR
jgi:hypothetical protein